MFVIVDNKPYYCFNEVLHPCTVTKDGYKVEVGKSTNKPKNAKLLTKIEVLAKLGEGATSIEEAKKDTKEKVSKSK